MHITDQLIYPEQPRFTFTDFVLTPLRVVFQGRSYDCRTPRLKVESPIYPLALRIIAGLAAIILLPITLAALSLKCLYMKKLNEVIAEAKRMPVLPLSPHFGMSCLGMSGDMGNPIVNASDMRDPVIDHWEKTIEYCEYFEGRDPYERALFEAKLTHILNKLNQTSEEEVWAQNYLGMGHSEFYVFDQEGVLKVVDSESLSHPKEPLEVALAEKLSQADIYTLLTPAKRRRDDLLIRH